MRGVVKPWQATLNHSKWIDYMVTLQRYANAEKGIVQSNSLAFKLPAGIRNRKPGTLVLSRGFDDGAVVTSYAWKDVNFGSTFSWASEPRSIFSDIATLAKGAKDLFNNIKLAVQSNNHLMDTPEGAATLALHIAGQLDELDL
jgi:hypothetical protein